MGGGEAGLLGVCRRCCCLDSQPVEPTATGMGGSHTWPGALGPQGTPDTKRRPPQSQESDTQCQPRWPTGCTVNIPEKPCAGASASPGNPVGSFSVAALPCLNLTHPGVLLGVCFTGYSVCRGPQGTLFSILLSPLCHGFAVPVLPATWVLEVPFMPCS